ncbi:hypothetical protein BTO06_11995 [Tenacibaculum sp. SZ-18]|nr:hypothetical protein BTO06_11995 [Tenacibaculum sp. SZ-18]
MKKEKNYAEINIKIDNTKFVEVNNPLEDIYIWDMKKDTIYPNPKNEFLFKKDIVSPEFVIVKIGEKRLKSIIHPDSRIEIVYTDSLLSFKGKNAQEMKLLNQLNRSFFNLNDFSEFRKDTSSLQITQKIERLKNNELIKLTNIRQNETKLVNVLKEEINYFYALKTQKLILNKLSQNKSNKEELTKLFNHTTKTYPLNTSYKNSSWLDYADNILLYKPLYDLESKKTITSDSIQKMIQNDTWYPFQFKIINKFKDSKIAEKVSANFIMKAAKQRRFEKSLIKVFNQFQDLYPRSAYIKYLKPEIKIIESYYKKVLEKIPENVILMKGENISTMKELLNSLKGEKYYIDIWATWCGACKSEFKFNNQLDSLLKSKNYKKLLISLDNINDEDKWKENIKYYELQGQNILASQELQKDLMNNYNVKSIPKYFITNEKGELINKSAPKPSEIDLLDQELY